MSSWKFSMCIRISKNIINKSFFSDITKLLGINQQAFILLLCMIKISITCKVFLDISKPWANGLLYSWVSWYSTKLYTQLACLFSLKFTNSSHPLKYRNNHVPSIKNTIMISIKIKSLVNCTAKNKCAVGITFPAKPYWNTKNQKYLSLFLQLQLGIFCEDKCIFKLEIYFWSHMHFTFRNNTK